MRNKFAKREDEEGPSAGPGGWPGEACTATATFCYTFCIRVETCHSLEETLIRAGIRLPTSGAQSANGGNRNIIQLTLAVIILIP